MLEVAIMADDMTGAADTGVQFLPALAPAFLMHHRRLSSTSFEATPGAVSFYTNTRATPPTEAKKTVQRAAEALKGLWPRRVYKKIDSTLRGNIGVELEVLLEELNLQATFIAPAFPEQGRTTFEGTYRVHNLPIAKTEIAHDPVTPVSESRLPVLIARQTRQRVGHIGLEFLGEDTERTVREIERLASLGIVHYTFDVIEQIHLDRIARLALEHYPGVLLCGSAGLAKSLAKTFSHRDEHLATLEDIPLADGHFLLVCGSASEILRAQVDELIKTSCCSRKILDPSVFLQKDCRTPWMDLLGQAASELSARDLLLQIGPPGEEGPSGDPEMLVKGLARFVAFLVKRTPPGGLFLSGGDTASAVLDALGVHWVELVRQISSGMVQGRIIGGTLTDRPLVTKAGAFGRPKMLVNVFNLLSRRKVNALEDHPSTPFRNNYG